MEEEAASERPRSILRATSTRQRAAGARNPTCTRETQKESRFFSATHSSRGFWASDDPRVVLESALDLVVLIGMPVVEARIRALATHAKTELQDIRQVEMKTNMEPSHSGGVIKFRLHNVPTKRAYDTLWERYRTSIAMTASGDSEGLRLSPHIYNSTDQIDRAVAAVRGLA